MFLMDRQEREDSDALPLPAVYLVLMTALMLLSSCSSLLSQCVSVRFGKASVSNRTKAVLLCLESSQENML